MNHGVEAFGHDEVHTKEMFFGQTCTCGAQLWYSKDTSCWSGGEADYCCPFLALFSYLTGVTRSN